MKLLLLSNSTTAGRGYLEHASGPFASALDGVDELLFVPYALNDHDGYTRKVAVALEPLGVAVRGAHEGDPAALARDAGAIFVGGGNTFRLADALQRLGLIEAIRSTVAAGAPYIGSSAGTNVACPSLRTTNDMPIVQPLSFDTLGLVPFQINPHYLDPDPSSTHQGETREVRLLEFLEENPGPVLAMREGTWLEQNGDRLVLEGEPPGARLFIKSQDPSEISTGTDLSHLLAG